MYREKLEPTLERLQTTRSIEDLHVWAHELRDRLAVRHVIYHTANLKGEQVGAFTYDIAWVRHYIARNYRAIDPVVLGALRRFHPMDWKTLDWSGAQARRMMREALEHGLGNQGWSVPIWGPSGEFAMFSVNHQADDAAWQDYTRVHAKDILLVSHLVHQQARRILDSEGQPVAPRARGAGAAQLRREPGAGGGRAPHLREHAARLYRFRPAQARRDERHPCRGARHGAGDHRAERGVAEILRRRTLGLS